MRVAFFVGAFPVVSETFILRQITGLIDRGHEVDIYAEREPDVDSPVHPEVASYGLMSRTTYVNAQMPVASGLLFKLLPVLVLCLSFGLFYMLIPNTKVNWKAALVGGVVGGMLWHFNNMFSVLYVSRVVSNSRFYGSLGMVPVFMTARKWAIMVRRISGRWATVRNMLGTLPRSFI